ncbi:Vitamin B12 import ATP-binding protein BtuD [Roseobacter fucihabitans]|uniref:Vitamin B12 import ATP-binding protein BtuD n=1 Tax=Roseobacter fucihabitans TaxID=1537242 RepID=A0ABZ2C249_9RHOB|nr:ABC transporter ATP-binding protein [Roseobacter litoralis]MBC6963937.1 Lipid A export ATP-binding/permease protein MsbA [Roseobacter litoralis]MBC6963978.1 Lipid A export ATP-binding/permease protein MsbA [Roseobacter litoralis]
MSSKTVSLSDKLSRSFVLWGKVIALLKFSDKRLGIFVFVASLFEIALTLGALFAVKLAVEDIAQTAKVETDIDLARVMGSVVVVLALFLGGRIMHSLANYFRAAQGFIVSDYVNRAIQERAVAADLSFYDSSLYYDTLERARQAGAQRPAQVISNALNVFRGGMMLLGIAVVLFFVEWRLLPISLIAVGLMLVVQVRFTRQRFHLQRRLVQKERHASYADWVMTAQPFAKEIRLWDIGAYLRAQYMNIRKVVRKDYLDIERRKSIAESLVSVVGTLVVLASAAFILYRFSTGQAELSDLIMVVLLLVRAETAGRDFVTSLSKLYDDQLFLTQLFTFLDLEPVMKPDTTPKPLPAVAKAGVVLEDVTFSYPASERPALRNVSLKIKPGQFTALVGGNGSGKTTLIKLLCRLYDPQEGAVTYDGEDVRSFDPIAYRRQFSVIFQDFAQFAYTGRDNMRLSDLGRDSDAARLEKAARLTGAHEVLEELPHKYDTVLSRMFDGGVELSGGQWQKIALSRAIFPDSKFIILDEPTSAIDPNAEAELFDGFREKLEGRGALVISHRLSTIRQADYTYVLNNGRIAEEGTHEELIRQNGRYAEMFERQGRGYRS